VTPLQLKTPANPQSSSRRLPGLHVVNAPTGDRRADAADLKIAQRLGGDGGGLLGVCGRPGKEPAQGEGEEVTEHWRGGQDFGPRTLALVELHSYFDRNALVTESPKSLSERQFRTGERIE
jgi:hypothetical protein